MWTTLSTAYVRAASLTAFVPRDRALWPLEILLFVQ